MSGVIDVGVVGAGPAGLAAALAAGDLGCEVTLIDTGSGPGGQMYHQSLLFPSRDRDRRAAGDHLPPRLARIRAGRPGRYLAATSVERAERDDDGVVTLWVGGPEGGAETTVEVRTVVLATGAAELVLPFPGWDLPGVTTAGAAQALLAGQGVTVGRRVLVGGSGPLLLPVAAALAEAGVQVAGVLEAARATTTWSPEAVAALARHQVPVRPGCAVIGCRGTGRVERAVIAELDDDWRPVPGSQREEIVDAVHLNFGFSPALELPRALGCAEVPHPSRPVSVVASDAGLATSVPGVFAAGAVTGTEGASPAELEGYLAGSSAARYLNRLDGTGYAARARALRDQLEAVRQLAARPGDAGPLGPGWLQWPDPGTVVCRCEETRWSDIAAALAAGARDEPAVRRATRCGTGYCQGLVCGPALQDAVARWSPG
jgi:thioredoxin reductase